MNYLEYKNKFKIQLNEQQEKAVLDTQGAILLLAVPGSGKTTVIVSRIGYMIYCLNIKPENILTLTYSVAASEDMKERFKKVFGEEQIEKIKFSTINSFCLTILKKYEKEYKTKIFKIIENPNKIINYIYHKITNEYPTENTIKEILGKISFAKNMMLDKNDIKEIKIEKINLYDIYTKYENYKIKNKLMDFDDQLNYAKIILEKFPSILKEIKIQYTYIQIDEAQDTSKLQHKIIKRITGNNIFMVGDEDQSIYKFRAAYPEALLEFEKNYKNSKILFMEKNYRSTEEILKIANKLIKQNKNRKNKNIISNVGKGKEIKLIELFNIEEQYRYIIKSLKKYKNQLAILYRNNSSAIILMEELKKQKIKFNIKEQENNFFSDKLINDIKNIIQYIIEPYNFKIFKKIYYKINCGISKIMIENIEKIIKNNNKENILEIILKNITLPLWQAKKIINIKREIKLLKNKNSFQIINAILDEIGYKRYIEGIESNISTYNQKINVILAIAKRNNKINKFLKELLELEKIIKQGSKTQSNITLSTIHSSKGLEYNKVIIIDMINGILPIISKSKIKDEKETKELKEQYEEEIRLFYVAITRAKRELEIITYKNDYLGKKEKSEFIEYIF